MQPGSLLICVDDSKWSVWATRTYSCHPVKCEWSHYATYNRIRVYMERRFKETYFKEVLPLFDKERELTQSIDKSRLITIK
jgi:hypothetical protein